MREIRKIDLMSYGKIMAAIMAIFGFVMGLVVSIAALFAGSLSTATFGFAAVFGVLAIILLPIIYAIIGFVMGIIGAAIYNFIASKIGGVKIDLK